MEETMRSATTLAAVGLAGAVIGLLWGLAPARADVCFDLWVERNSIYKEYGYCFKTPKAINYFGNAGCQDDYESDIPFSLADKGRVLAIKKRERTLGCR
jgi:YARHG domain